VFEWLNPRNRWHRRRYLNPGLIDPDTREVGTTISKTGMMDRIAAILIKVLSYLTPTFKEAENDPSITPSRQIIPPWRMSQKAGKESEVSKMEPQIVKKSHKPSFRIDACK